MIAPVASSSPNWDFDIFFDLNRAKLPEQPALGRIVWIINHIKRCFLTKLRSRRRGVAKRMLTDGSGAKAIREEVEMK
jgi:hypothetical protein